MEELIKDKLSEIEREYAIRMLYACESGSRAWGFPSADSDYDVRFIYAHDLDWHLSLKEEKETIVVDFCDDAVFISNVITPNGDSYNENFELMGIDNENCIVSIYGRHGILKYQSRAYQNDWNGAGLPSGVYYYHVFDLRSQRSFEGWLHILY